MMNVKWELLKVAALRVGDYSSGLLCVYLFEHCETVNYSHLLQLLNQYHGSPNLTMTKAELKDLLSLAESDK